MAGEQRRLPASLAPLLDGQENGVGMGRGPVKLQHLEDGGLEFAGAVTLEEPVEARDGALQRATAEMFASGSQLSKRIRRFSSSLQARRRWRPVITSTR
jgi:hypothetical protein